MILSSPGPIAFEIGPLTIRWYGIIIAIAFIIGLLVTTKIAKKQNENPEHILDLASYLLVGCAISARLYYVIFNWQYYSQHLSDTFKIWQGGLSIHGAIIGGFIILAIYTKIHKLSFLKYADIIAYGAILGQAIGRWGNFFNSEAFGAPTNSPIKLYIPPEARPIEYKQCEFFHPTFLYESIWNLLVFLLLYFVVRKKFKGQNGVIVFTYLILYSIGRIIIESIRIDSIYSIFGIPLAQFISVIIILIGIIGLYYVTRNKKHAGQ
ncbi:MAG: prolipoprotein diacylglyceryl transferase [Candidatus Melainabacteria bacterium RIFOXYA12_FULL_32_12]|nr:MAG: prolipoprotein diacylglyceryl transferase [Candidatus Melainabacteria bacterium RIFOXYA12_FULL_32_12]